MDKKELLATLAEQLKRSQPLWARWMLQDQLAPGQFRISDGTEERLLEIALVPAREQAEAHFRILRSLNGCPQIVQCFDVQTEPFLLGDFLAGHSQLVSKELLTSVPGAIRQKKLPLTENNVLRLACEIGEAICYAHHLDILHRSIQPGKLYVTADGRYKLDGFGQRDPLSGRSYVSPASYQYASGTAPLPLQKQADIYAFGITLYRLLNNGLFPLQNNDTPEAEAVARRREGLAFPPPPGAGQRFGEIILRACAPEAAMCYASMDEMLADLKALRQSKERPAVQIAAPMTASPTPAPAPEKPAEPVKPVKPTRPEPPETEEEDDEEAVGQTNTVTQAMIRIMCALLIVICCMLIWLLWNVLRTDSKIEEKFGAELIATQAASAYINSGQEAYVTLHAASEEGSSVLARLYTGQEIGVYDLNNGWYHVCYDTMDGYVREEAVSFGPIGTEPTTKAEATESILTEIPTLPTETTEAAETAEPTEVPTLTLDPVSRDKYTLIRGKYTWEQARSYCEEHGGHLATIHSDQDWNELIAVVKKAKQSYPDLRFFWLGAKTTLDDKLNMSLTWVDNSETSYIISDSNHWYYNSRLETWEPSGYDTYEYRKSGTLVREPYLLLWNMGPDGKEGTEWTLNDVPDLSDYAQYRDSNMGFIMQFDD